MSRARWVQHVSGQGDKWPLNSSPLNDVVGEFRPLCWDVSPQPGLKFHLPRKEYILCEPPEQWMDVTSECYQYENMLMRKHEDVLSHQLTQLAVAIHAGYRLRKLLVNEKPNFPAQWAFIVERMKA